jgi:hypothetical protein
MNINSAQTKLEMNTLEQLGDMATLGYDGVEFSYNNKPVLEGIPGLMKILILENKIAPPVAESFVKQASQNKVFRFYMSKKADFDSGGGIPSYGEDPFDTSNDYPFGLGLGTAVTQSSQATKGDTQTSEATLLSELLQAPDMKDYVTEYLPEIKAGMDKLGRLLFLARLNMSKLFTGDNASELFNLVGSLRNVYRLLGDNYVKLSRLATVPDDSAPTTD